MKRLLFSLVLTLGVFAQASDNIVVRGTVPAGASIKLNSDYESQSDSLFCSHLTLDESANLHRIRNIYRNSAAVPIAGNAFALNVAQTLSKCGATLSGFTMDVFFTPSQIGTVQFQMSANNVTETQKIQCETRVFSTFSSIVCDDNIIVGADGKANVEITLKP